MMKTCCVKHHQDNMSFTSIQHLASPRLAAFRLTGYLPTQKEISTRLTIIPFFHFSLVLSPPVAFTHSHAALVAYTSNGEPPPSPILPPVSLSLTRLCELYLLISLLVPQHDGDSSPARILPRPLPVSSWTFHLLQRQDKNLSFP